MESLLTQVTPFFFVCNVFNRIMESAFLKKEEIEEILFSNFR